MIRLQGHRSCNNDKAEELFLRSFQQKHRVNQLDMLNFIKMRLHYLHAKNAPPLLGSVETSQVWCQYDMPVKAASLTSKTHV